MAAMTDGPVLGAVAVTTVLSAEDVFLVCPIDCDPVIAVAKDGEPLPIPTRQIGFAASLAELRPMVDAMEQVLTSSVSVGPDGMLQVTPSAGMVEGGS